MPIISVLPDVIKSQIAAGEVVERPASVLRELIENSIDAESTAIEIAVERAGVKLIRVADDGTGMDSDDARLCLMRHATSKLRHEEDLSCIRTMGFRGEALPSIASISRFTLTTAPRGAKEGVMVRVEGGDIKDVRAGAAMGTTIEVRDIFYNTPARKKFLKSPSTELAHIIDTVTRLALSHPFVGFRLNVDGQDTMALPRAGGLRERLSQVYGPEFADELIDVRCGDGGLGVFAFVSRPDALRDRRTHQFVFINNRPVRDPSVAHAVYCGFEGILPKEKHPVFFLYLQVDPRGVDFNVHPAKREVRFKRKDEIYKLVLRCVRSAFIPRDAGPDQHSVRQTAAGFDITPQTMAFGQGETIPFEAAAFGLGDGREFLYLGDMFVAFVAQGGGITIMDHHAAHERVLYERILGGVSIEGGRLLFPRQVRLSTKEYMVLLDNKDMLEGFGLELEDFGQDTVIVRSVPEFMEHADLRGILSEAAHEIASGQRPGRTMRESIAMRMACHASVRGAAMLGQEALNALLRDLKASAQPDYCPHGRPTTITYTTDELQKLFKRK